MSVSPGRSAADMDTSRRSQIMDNIVAQQQQAARQQEQIRAMTEDNDQLKRDITMVSGKQYDYVKADKLATLQSSVDALERRYQFEKMRKNDLTKRYQLARIDLLHSRKARGGVNVEKEQTDAVQRQVDILENRLDQALTKFNDALLYNKELREQIDIIREERRVFQRVHKKMEDNLAQTQRQTADRIERTNRDMDERDEYRRQAQQLQQAIAEQQDEYNEQVRELDSAMNDIKTMREDQTNLQLELESREYEFTEHLAKTQANAAANNASNNTTNGMANATTASRSAVLGGNEDGASSTVAPDDDSNQNILAVDKESQNINAIAAQLADATHEQDINQLFKNYEKLGEDNFSLYKYIHSLTATKESLGDEIRDLKTLLSEENAEEAYQQRVVRELEGKLATTEFTLEEIGSTVEKMREALRIVGTTTEDVHQHIGCGNVTCTESNLLSTLGDIEERATYILCATQRQQYQTQMSSVKNVTGTAATSAVTAEGDDAPGTADLSQNSAPGEPAQPDYEVAPLLPLIAPQYAQHSVSAKRLVRQTDLPSAALGTNDNHGHGLTGTAAGRTAGNTGALARDESLAAGLEVDDTQVVSHDDVRRQMEMHLLTKRDKDDRMARKKKEIKDMIGSSPKKGVAGAGSSPSKGTRY